jgi:hypothetical protein
MKNRAKCKKCNDIIESFHPTDYVTCSCGAIALDGGDAMYCFALAWDDFVRVDDKGNEIITKIVDDKMPSDTTLSDVIQPTNKREQILADIEQLIKIIEGLPTHALDSPITHRDYLSLLGLISSVIRLSS